mmetsp:Transcript_7242/g.12239  ORF Transcript_7242/g.12239 Transcript_7242/m.12239 type:complete len:90 (+) Transcript_7242:673-942(+)
MVLGVLHAMVVIATTCELCYGRCDGTSSGGRGQANGGMDIRAANAGRSCDGSVALMFKLSPFNGVIVGGGLVHKGLLRVDSVENLKIRF